ncbi:MAG TPA: hypothetical protein VNT30_11950 [Stellaceae bacterium]|nr:hypothetical protein [Stellaceae bacterium]
MKASLETRLGLVLFERVRQRVVLSIATLPTFGSRLCHKRFPACRQFC